MSNIQKSWFCPTAPPTFAHFCPFLGQIGIFLEKWHHHLKRLMVLYLYAKKYKKRLNGSKDIVIWKIEWSDWSRAFKNISQEQEFSRTSGFRRKLVNHKTLHFKPFLTKTNGWIFCKSPKTLFFPIFGPFLPIFGKMRIFLKNRAPSLFYIYGPLTSCKKLKKTNEPILRTLRHRMTDRQTTLNS